MENFYKCLSNYAQLMVKLGVDVQPGQVVFVRAPIGAVDLVHLVAEASYALGARRVHVEWTDDVLQRLGLLKAPTEELTNIPAWQVQLYDQMVENRAAVITIYSPNPQSLRDVDRDRLVTVQKASGEAFRRFMDATNSYEVPWTLVSVPNREWAKSVFPDVSADEAVDELWSCIFHATRADQPDPIDAWLRHADALKQRRDMLNHLRLRKLRYQAEGTQLEIALPEDHIWLGGRRVAQTGQSFLPNIPAEEVFTAPRKDGVNGTVRTTKPLNHGGRLIEPFSVTFEQGRAVSVVSANDEDQKLLDALLDMDDGSRFLGEVAIVPDDSPISKLGLIFQNTLFDENAACHLAFGNAYPTSLKGGPEMTKEQLADKGLNTSVIHVDFMVGSGTLDIQGEREDGSCVDILRQGKWVAAL